MTGKSEVPISVLMQYFRVPTGELVVDYPGREVLLGSCITNLSTTGVFVRTSNPLPKGTELDIVFTLPDTKIKITAHAVVRWSSDVDLGPGDPTAHTGMGLEFMRMSPRQRKAIAKFVEDFLQRMRKGSG